MFVKEETFLNWYKIHDQWHTPVQLSLNLRHFIIASNENHEMFRHVFDKNFFSSYLFSFYTPTSMASDSVSISIILWQLILDCNTIFVCACSLAISIGGRKWENIFSWSSHSLHALSVCVERLIYDNFTVHWSQIVKNCDRSKQIRK